MGLSRTVSEIYDDDFSRKSQFSHPCVFDAAANGVSLGIGYRRMGRKKTRMIGLPDGRKSFKMGLAV